MSYDADVMINNQFVDFHESVAIIMLMHKVFVPIKLISFCSGIV